jgi:hypothetical protein
MAMAALLSLATAGGIVRALAPDPSTLRDVGTLMLVLWLPAIGNLLGYLRGRLPHAAPPPTAFEPGSPFSPHLQARLERLDLPAGFAEAQTREQLGTVLVGRQGFTVRFAQPVAAWLVSEGEPVVPMELLRPRAAIQYLPVGTDFHLLVGVQPVAKGRVLG